MTERTLRATPFEVSFQGFPGDAFAPVPIEGVEAPVQFGALRLRQRQGLVLEAIPELSDQFKPLR